MLFSVLVSGRGLVGGSGNVRYIRRSIGYYTVPALDCPTMSTSDPLYLCYDVVVLPLENPEASVTLGYVAALQTTLAWENGAGAS